MSDLVTEIGVEIIPVVAGKKTVGVGCGIAIRIVVPIPRSQGAGGSTQVTKLFQYLDIKITMPPLREIAARLVSITVIEFAIDDLAGVIDIESGRKKWGLK